MARSRWWTASLVAVAAIAAASWRQPSGTVVSVLSGVPRETSNKGDSPPSRLLHEAPRRGSILSPASIAASGDNCVGRRENACDLAFSLEEVIPRANPVSRWPNWPDVIERDQASGSADESAFLEALSGDAEGWEELDGIVALGLEGVAARLLALAPGPDARASALMEIPRASKAVVTRFLGAVGAAPIGAPIVGTEKGASASPKRTRAEAEGYVPTERAPFARGHFGEVWRARGRARGREGGA